MLPRRLRTPPQVPSFYSYRAERFAWDGQGPVWLDWRRVSVTAHIPPGRVTP